MKQGSLVASLLLAACLLTGFAAAANGTSPPDTHRLAPSSKAEARLIAVYRLIGAGQAGQALAQAERLVQDYPNFQLAQLVYGDLLAARTRPVRSFGDVPGQRDPSTASTLEALQHESQMRLKALRERPPANSIPSQFLALSPRIKHAIAVDASRSRLYLFANSSQGLRLIADYYISVGKSGTSKQVEGDQRTPLGVYFITNNLNPKSLRDFYGIGALPINYPNVLDLRRGKTGHGIWLHGTPPNQFARSPQATDGCVVLANPDLDSIIRKVQVRTTPVVIAEKLEWMPLQAAQEMRKPFQRVLAAWQQAKSSGNVERLLSFYAADFQSRGKNLEEWSTALRQEVRQARARPIQFKDLSYLRWTDHADTMVVTFGEVPNGRKHGPTKRQYWIREGDQWKIFYEGVLG